MMTIRKILPSLALREYVRHFEVRVLVAEDHVVVRPLPARPEQLLIFHLADRYGSELFDHRSGKTFTTPPAGIIGPQTFRAVDALWKGRFLDFVISFQPTGFYRLFRFPMAGLTDRVYEASDVIGKEVHLLHEQLHQAGTIAERVCATEGFLLDKLAAVQPFHPVQVAAASVMAYNGRVNLDQLVRRTGLSQRQFERKFIEQVGMPPKLYCRINRLSYALRLKEDCPDLTWTDVTYEAGYFDQMHLVKDFKLLAGATPSEFFRLIAASPAVRLESGKQPEASVFYYRNSSHAFNVSLQPKIERARGHYDKIRWRVPRDGAFERVWPIGREADRSTARLE